MAGTPGAWVIRPEDRYTITYDYRGGKERFKKLKAALISHKDADLIDQILKSPLGQIYKAMENFNYSSTLVHQLLIRSVYSYRNDELRFRFRDSICRLGQTEFALITGLYFGVVEPDIRPVEDRNRSSLIECDNHVIRDVDMTMAPFRLEVSHITIGFLKKALMAATDAEIAYKLGLIYSIEAVLHGKASASNVSPFVFYLVEDIPRFLLYSWGSYFWDITLQDLMDKRDGMMSHIGRKVVKKDVTCLVYVLFVWAYETIPSVGLLIARYVANNKVIPRMLRWHPNEGNINHKFLSKNLDSQDHGVNTYFKPSDAEVQMLRGIGLTDDKINMPPLVCTIPRDASHQRGCVCPFPAPIYDTHRANAHSERVSAFDTAPPKSHSTIPGITQLHTELLGLRSYALSMAEEVLKDVKDGNEDVRENIDGARNDITYGRKLIRAELETVRNDSRNQYIGICSTLSTIESFINRHQFTRPPQPSTPLMREPKEYQQKVPNQQCHQHTREDHQLGDKQNQEHGFSMNFDKEQIRPASKFTPDRLFRPCPPPIGPQTLPKHEVSLHVVKRKIDGRKDGSSMLSKKEHIGDVPMMGQYTPRPPVAPGIRPLPPEPRELWPDLQVAMHDNATPLSDEFVLDVGMRKASCEKTPKDDGVDDPIMVPDSTSCDSATPTPRRVISALLPNQPRSRRPTQRPGKLQDFVDPSTVARNKRSRYDPFRPIDLGKWLGFRDWYNNPVAPDMKIEGVYYNLTCPMFDGHPYWFETLYTSKRWLDVSHVNAYMYLLRGRMQKHRSSFKSNVCIFSHDLGVFDYRRKKKAKKTGPAGYLGVE